MLQAAPNKSHMRISLALLLSVIFHVECSSSAVVLRIVHENTVIAAKELRRHLYIATTHGSDLATITTDISSSTSAAPPYTFLLCQRGRCTQKLTALGASPTQLASVEANSAKLGDADDSHMIQVGRVL
jgi:hypothetical protein